jgi:hypothetical protein
MSVEVDPEGGTWVGEASGETEVGTDGEVDVPGDVAGVGVAEVKGEAEVDAPGAAGVTATTVSAEEA